MNAFLAAFSLAGGQIISIGPQNAFVLRQGVAARHVPTVVAICIACDVLLMTTGVFGVSAILQRQPLLMQTMVWGGIALLVYMGAAALHSACRVRRLDVVGQAHHCRRQVIIKLLLVTLLNPYVWLDTVLLVGGVSLAYGEQQLAFMAGAISASIVWFSLVGFGARYLAGWFSRPASWRLLDLLVGGMMWLCAWQLYCRLG